MNDQLFGYAKIELTTEPKVIIIPEGLDDYQEHAELISGFGDVAEEYLPASDIIDYTTAELLVPAFASYLADLGGDLAEEISELGGVLVTQVIRLTGPCPSVLVLVTMYVGVDDDDEEEEDDDEAEETWN